MTLLAVLASCLIFESCQRSDRERWARDEGIQGINRLVKAEDYAGAFSLAQEVDQWIPDNPELADLWDRVSVIRSIETTPDGADVYLRTYRDTQGEWKHLGQTPLYDIRIPRGVKRWRIEKQGFVTLDIARSDFNQRVDQYSLIEKGAIPPEMVYVQGWTTPYMLAGLTHREHVTLEDYLIDRYEVTNEQFRQFIDEGGYRNQDYWNHPFVKEERTLTWQAAMEEFVDKTGRSGPSTWELGSYPPGQGEYPVRGVSWYEAAAYAVYAGKSLPTVIHWAHASSPWFGPQMIPLSNLGGSGPVPAGGTSAVSHFGAFDMAGNVKEWCWNASGENRFILGGAWEEPGSRFSDPDTQSPFTRLATYGFRCAKFRSPVPEAAAEPIEFSRRHFNLEKPVSEAEFEGYRRLYSYERTPLHSSIDSVDESADHWIKQSVSFDAAYGGERVSGYLLLPKGGKPPYQAVVYFPPSNAFASNSSQELAFEDLEFLVSDGRAVFYPIYKGTYERREEPDSTALVWLNSPALTDAYRNHVIMWSKDLGRAVDYLESRSDIDDQRLAYYGYSAGAVLGVILTALEDRFRASVLHSGGFEYPKTFPEVDQLNFAPRVNIPTLMLNGRYDLYFPVETSQEPMFRALGTPNRDKHHAIFEAGHTVPRDALIRETLAWLDRYLGSVSP